MKEYTFDELIEMDKKAIEDIDTKLWKVENIISTQKRLKNPVVDYNKRVTKLSSWDKKEIIIKGICPVVGMGLLAAGIFAAVKYYVDETFVQEDDE